MCHKFIENQEISVEILINSDRTYRMFEDINLFFKDNTIRVEFHCRRTLSQYIPCLHLYFTNLPRKIYDKIVLKSFDIDRLKTRNIFYMSYACTECRPHISSKCLLSLSLPLPLFLQSNHAC